MINVYLISSESISGRIYKIGITRRSISKRMKEFKTGNASELLLIDSYNSKWGNNIESHLHRLFKEKRISGEWFKLDESDLTLFKDVCVMVHDNLELIENNNNYYIDRGCRF